MDEFLRVRLTVYVYDSYEPFIPSQEQEENRKYENPSSERRVTTANHERILADKIELGLSELRIDDESRPTEDVSIDPSAVLSNSELRRKQYIDQMQKQREAYTECQEIDDILSRQTEDEVWQSQKYLSEQRVMASSVFSLTGFVIDCLRNQNEWDCETILSTYSTLDNHPTIIKVIGLRF